MAKIYILYVAWIGTMNNHTGMAYYLKEIKKRYPNEIVLIRIPANIGNWSIYLKRICLYFGVLVLKRILLPDSKVLFMEYLGAGTLDTKIAIKLRGNKVTCRLYGFVHLSGDHLLEFYGGHDFILKGAKAVDKIIVFGSKLTAFFDSLGFGNKVIQTFHYVDNNYYKPSARAKKTRLQVLHIGTHKRNFNDLKKIIELCSNIEFHVFQGGYDLKDLFDQLPNVVLYEFLPEKEVLKVMQQCHVSLSVLYDTVGSNVITTSMACGLVNVASDVGSIKDYCNTQNSILCKNTDEFVASLNELDCNRTKLNNLSTESLNYSFNFSIEKSIDFFYKEIINK